MTEKMTPDAPAEPAPPPRRRRYVPAVGPRLRPLLAVVLGLFALLGVNATYLSSITVAEFFTGAVYQDYFYQLMFLVHLVLGLAMILPVIIFGVVHIRNAHNRPNRRAVKAGYALFAVSLALIASGLVLTRLEGVIDVKDPGVRSFAYWIHVITPLAAVWIFILHRLAGRKIRWRVGAAWAAVAGAFALAMLVLQVQDPREWNVEGNPEGEKYFFPSLARTVSGDFIPADTLMNDAYCQECHEDVHRGWLASAHRFSSFNNPVYLFSVRETRQVALERDGNVNAARFCAGCHDPVPFFSGRFNDPSYDDVNDPTSQAGVTCTSCHMITHVNSVRGNGDFTIDVPVHYPFARSESAFLRWVNRTLIKAKPEFHKKTFLKPLHRTTEFCGACHKVHIPEELNHYKWLRGQNHYDSFQLSGVSGQGVASFYYPEKAEESCNGCHMPLIASDDFSSRVRDETGIAKTLDHQFPSANTALPHLMGRSRTLTPEHAQVAVEAHRKFNQGVMRVDIFGVRQDAAIDGELIAPLRPDVPALEPGREYLIETVIRTLKMGHVFTQGTADSNEVWLDVVARSGDRVIGRSGGLHRRDRSVDPWSHFVNAFVLDRDGNRIDRRNVQDIFVALYDNQIPPGAADVVHYRLRVPPDATEPIEVTVRLRFRKFGTALMRHVTDEPDYVNDLPILELAEDTVVFPVAGGRAVPDAGGVETPEWQRWNDYGIGLLRKRGTGELRQAEEAFRRVERLGRPDGPLNLARVYLREGRIQEDAPDALRRARDFEPPAREWSVLWFSGLVQEQNGSLDEAIRAFQQILEGGFRQAQGRGFDFGQDYRVLNELGSVLYARAKRERGEARRPRRRALLERAAARFQETLRLEPENARAHYNLKQIYLDLGDEAKSEEHGLLHARYKLDDNARDRAVAAARARYPAADRAAEAVVIYDLQRPEAFGLPGDGRDENER